MESVILRSVWKVRKMENNYQLSRIHNYVNGLMSKEDMHALEREALEDPFLQDAIDGYKLQNGVDIKQVSLLQQRLAARVQEQVSGRNKRFYNWQRLAIGMTAGVMFVTVCTLLLMRYLPKENTVDMKELVIKDVIYEYSISPLNNESDAVPVGGWETFYEVLNTKYSNSQNYEGTIHVRFEIDANQKAKNIKTSGFPAGMDEELEDIIRNKVKWKGNRGSFVLEMYKISL